MVEDGRLGGSRRRAVVVTGDRVQQLGEDGGIEVACAFLDHPQPEVDVTEQPPLVRLPECGPGAELADPSDVVQERRGERGGRERSRGCSCAVSRQSVATPTVCSSRPPA